MEGGGENAMPARLIAPTLVLAAAVGLAACSDYSNRGYGYSRVAVGVGTGYGYGSPYYRSSYRTPYWGWYGGYYYPGVGYYVYDRRGSRHRWSDGHRRYWEGRRPRGRYSENWSGYRRDDRRYDRDDRRGRRGRD